MNSSPPFPKREPYTCKLVEVKPHVWELQINSGGIRHGWSGDGFAWIRAYGSEAHAVAKAKRILAKLNAQPYAGRVVEL